MLKLLIATIKLYVRDTEALFWTLVFPALFIIIFSFFSFGDSIDSRILLVNNTDSKEVQTLIDQLQTQAGAGINTSIENVDDAKNTLEKSEDLDFEYFDEEKQEFVTEKGRVNVAMIINPSEEEGKAYHVEILYNESDEGQASPSGILTASLQQVTTSMTLAQTGVENPFEIERTGISVNEIEYIDILTPGIIGMSIMQSGIIGIASDVATLKEKRVLKRLSATPLATWKFFLAHILTHLVLSVVQVTVMIVLATQLLNANIYGSIPLIYFLSFIGNFVFLGLGFITAAVSSTTRAAENFAQVFTTPMMFLSGVFFERDSLPTVVKTIADFLPLSPLLDALREVSIKQAGLYDVREELLIIALWTLATSLIAFRVFRFREE